MAFDGELIVGPNRQKRTLLYIPVRDAARRTLIAGLAERGVSILDPTILADEIARETLRAFRSTDAKRTGGQVGENSRAIAAMEVGDVLSFPPGPHQTARDWMLTARKLMGNAQAAWRYDSTATGFDVTRVPDGASTKRGPPRSRFTLFLAALKVGETRTFAGPRLRGIESHNRQTARKLLGDPSASWIALNTNKGLRVTRVS